MNSAFMTEHHAEFGSSQSAWRNTQAFGTIRFAILPTLPEPSNQRNPHASCKPSRCPSHSEPAASQRQSSIFGPLFSVHPHLLEFRPVPRQDRTQFLSSTTRSGSSKTNEKRKEINTKSKHKFFRFFERTPMHLMMMRSWQRRSTESRPS